jgi:hypothetical protein
VSVDEWVEARRTRYPYEIRLPILRSKPPDVVDADTGLTFASAPYRDHTRVWMFESEEDLDRFMEYYAA